MLARAGFVLAGQTARLVPADRAAVRAARRDRDRRVDPADRVVDPVQEGRRGAPARWSWTSRSAAARSCPTRASARALARTLIALGRRLGLPVRALLTDMDQPLGDAIGNAVEVREAIDVLRGGGPRRRARADRAPRRRDAGARPRRARSPRRRRAGSRRAIASGAGLERFRLGVRLQGGDPRAIDDPRACRAPATHARRARGPRAASSRASTPACSGGPRRCSARAACARRTASRPAPRSSCTPRSAAPVARGDRAGHRRVRRRRPRARRPPADRPGVRRSAHGARGRAARAGDAGLNSARRRARVPLMRSQGAAALRAECSSLVARVVPVACVRRVRRARGDRTAAGARRPRPTPRR